MTDIGWWSQPFAPEGSVAAEGIVKQLGRPQMDPLTVMVREAAQNSWDARRDTGCVDFSVSLSFLGPLADAWREELLPPPDPSSKSSLDETLGENSVLVTVSDRNTVGLGGPIRAGTRPGADEKPDFVQFMRNVGEPRDHEFGGGTYGFGKGIFYRLSRAGTIVVDTRTAEDVPSRRLMGATLGESYYIEDRRYTGRHWWGQLSDVVADPLLDADADAISRKLGLPGFGEADSGTDIVIIGADLGLATSDPDSPQRTLGEAAEHVASAILWHLWPKQVADREGRFMRFRVTAGGRQIIVPAPEAIDDLAPFVDALHEVRSGGGTRYGRTVEPKNAGSFSLKLMPASTSVTSSFIDLARPFVGSPHHVARMRAPELVVDYFPGPPHSDARFAYAAVFKASPEADAAFAASEPPTHDDWIARGLSGTQQGVVRYLARFLNREISQVITPQVDMRGESSHGLGELSARLGALIPTTLESPPALSNGAEENGAGRDGSPVGGSTVGSSVSGQRNSVRKPRITGSPRLEIYDGEARVVAGVEIPKSERPRTVRIGVDVVVDGGRTEDSPPEGAGVPTVLQWHAENGTIVNGPVVTVQPDDPVQWSVHASYVDNAVVRFRVTEIEPNGARHAQ